MAVFSKIPMYKKVNAGQIIFTSSQIWTVPRGVKKIDVFLVGGAGGGGIGYFSQYQDGAIYTRSYHGGGGGGGYVATYRNVDVVPNTTIEVIVGSGGSIGVAGNPSLFGTFSVNGGNQGLNATDSGGGRGGNGGSGGGAGGGIYIIAGTEGGSTTMFDALAATGGINGANGENSYNRRDNNNLHREGGSGQGSTTRAFGEATGALYASGGNAGAISENQRSHGAGGNGSTTSAGNSGIVIVR